MFKEEYQKEMNQIKPSPDFLKNLAAQMEQEAASIRAEEEAKSKIVPISRKKNNAAWVSVAAAAVVCIGVAFAWQGNKGTTEDDNYMTQNAGVATDKEADSTEGVFSGSAWYGDETDAEKIYAIMLENMENTSYLSIMQADSNSFRTAHAMAAPQAEELVAKLAGGKIAKDVTVEDLSGMEAVYYLAELDDGMIITFTVYDETYFYCSEFEGIFSL